MKYIAVHHTAVKNTKIPQLQAVNRYHKQKWNMKSRLGWYVGYNYFIDVDGTVTQTRSWTEEQVAQKGHNCDVPERCDTISICMANDYNSIWCVPDAQENALMDIIMDIKKHYPDIRVVGHRDLQEGRTCPGEYIEKEDFENWNKDSYDEEDKKKAEEIKKLQSTLDWATALLRKLLAIVHGKQ